MGTHPNAPSHVHGDSNQSLGSILRSSPALLNPQVHQAYEGDLPFLFKVLSVNLALSIQAHPNKALARELFKTRPDVYKDPNHKPEMAISLTPFEALCGFRPLREISDFLGDHPELREVVGEQVAGNFVRVVSDAGAGEEAKKHALKDLFGSLMRADPKKVAEELQRLIKRTSHTGGADGGKIGVDELVARLNSQFPNDVGCFCVFVLNYMTLQPGQAIFLAANLPHAYLSGGNPLGGGRPPPPPDGAEGGGGRDRKGII